MTLGGRRRSKFFADGGYVTKAAALRAAKAYRDELEALRALQPRPVPRPILVTRGKATSYQIRIPKPDGGTTTTEFSTRVHGVHEARQLALDAYHAAAKRAGLKPADRGSSSGPARHPVRTPPIAGGQPKQTRSDHGRRKRTDTARP